MQTTLQLCRWALDEGDPDEKVKELVDELGELDGRIQFVLFAWSQFRTMNAFMLEMEIAKIRAAQAHLPDPIPDEYPF